MPTCPNCGEIVMNGDPYCPHCGATFRGVDDEYEMKREREYRRPININLENVPANRFRQAIEKLQEPDYITKGILKSFDLTNAKNTFVDIRQLGSGGDIDIFFKRKNKYFTTNDYVTYRCDMNEIEGYGFNTNFYNLENTEWFKRAVQQKEKETGLKYHSCGGGYDAEHHWLNANWLEIKDGCRVVAHFIKSESETLGYEVDFINHRLKRESKSYDRTTPYDLVADYDWVV